MILNEKIVNYKVAYLFESYNFCSDHFSIRDYLKNSKINFKLSVVALRYKNRHYKYIFTGCFLNTTVSSNKCILPVVNLRKQPVKMNLHWRFMIWTHNFISMAPALFEPPVKKRVTPRESTSVLVCYEFFL